MLRNRLKGRKLSEKTHHYRVQRYDKALRWHQVLLKKFLISEKTRQSESTDQTKRENEDTKRAETWFFLAWRGFLSSDDKLHYFARVTLWKRNPDKITIFLLTLQMRRAQAERSRTHTHEGRRKQKRVEALATRCAKGGSQAIFAPSFNEAIKREHLQNAKKDEAETSRHALL